MLNCIARLTQNTQNSAQESSIERVALPESTAPHTKQYEHDLYVDEQVLLQLVEDTDAEVVPELIMLYIEDSKQRIERINTAITKQDFDSLEFETHTIGSSAVAHGNAKLYSIARKIEHLCREYKHPQALQQAMLVSDIADKSFSLLAERANKGFI